MSPELPKEWNNFLRCIDFSFLFSIGDFIYNDLIILPQMVMINLSLT